MKRIFSAHAWADCQFSLAGDPAILRRLNEFIRDAQSSPFKGIGKPEPLVGPLKGWWSRRITLEHRLVYRVSGTGETQALEIAACRFHYRAP